MSLSKLFICIVISVALIFVVGCENKDSQQKTENKTDSQQGAVAGSKELVAQKICPVMGGEIDKSIAPVIKNGMKIYMCCEHCRAELTNKFEENVEKLKKLGQKPESI